MATGRAEGDVAADPDKVWALIGDFGGLASWMPGIEKCELDGDVRVLTTMGIEIREQLVERDDAARTIVYSIVGSPMPIERHKATITVTPGSSGSHVTWDVEALPDELIDAFVPIYQQGVEQIASQFA